MSTENSGRKDYTSKFWKGEIQVNKTIKRCALAGIITISICILAGFFSDDPSPYRWHYLGMCGVILLRHVSDYISTL